MTGGGSTELACIAFGGVTFLLAVVNILLMLREKRFRENYGSVKKI